MNLRKTIIAALTAGALVFGSSGNISPSVPKLDNEKGLGYYINLYVGTEARKKKFEEALNNLHERDLFYKPIFKEYSKKFKAEGFNLSPSELEHLSNAQEIVESFGNTREVSHCGAKGNMQFMPKTAELIGLKSNHYIDQRFDPFESKEKAHQFLFEQTAYFHSVGIEDSLNWAMLSYNSGIVAVLKLRKKGYWTPYQMKEGDACLETREYLWRNIAVNTILYDPNAFGLNPKTKKIKYFEDYVLQPGESLYSVSKKYNINMEDIVEYNPIKLFNLKGQEIKEYNPKHKEWRWDKIRTKLPVNYVLKIPVK